MQAFQIIVRSKLLNELQEVKYTGILHGRFTLVTPKQVQSEIQRRERILGPGNFWVRELY